MRQTFAEFLSEIKPGYSSEWIKRRPGSDNFNDRAYHFICYFSYQGREWGTYFSSGSACKGKLPSAKDVLECLQSDCQTGDNTYKEFCSEYDYNSVLSEGYSTWMACRQTRDDLIDLFGRRVYNQFMEIDFNA